MIYKPRVLQLDTAAQLRAELEGVGAKPSMGLEEQIRRAEFRIVRLAAVSLPLARLLYQELAMEGGLVATRPGLDHTGPGETGVLLCGTRYQLQHLIVRLQWQPSEDLQILADELAAALDNFDAPARGALRLGHTALEWGVRTYIMAIVNVTPDSFSGDGLIHPGDAPADFTARAVAQGRQFVADGADVLDVGGESTRPSATPVDERIEMERVIPVIEALTREIHVPVSVDTYKPQVARAAVEAGASLINDVWGGARDPEMLRVAAETGPAIVLMHNGRRPGGEPAKDTSYGDIIDRLGDQVDRALEAGIARERIMLDPGLGFGKSPERNLEIIDRLGELRVFGLPILIGPSRKGFVARALGLAAGETEEGTAAAVALGIARGADMVRVHDVRVMARVARMADAIARRGRE